MTMNQFPFSAFATKYLGDPQIDGDGVLLSPHTHATGLKAHPIADIAIGFHMENPERALARFLLVRFEHRGIAFVLGPHPARAIHRSSARTKEGRRIDLCGNSVKWLCVAPYESLRGARAPFHKFLEAIWTSLHF